VVLICFSIAFGKWRTSTWSCSIRKEKRKDSAGSDDTASMIKGGGYLGANTRQPPTAQAIKKKSMMWVRGVVCRSTRTQSLTVVACVILQCIPCFYECRCMSDGVFIRFVAVEYISECNTAVLVALAFLSTVGTRTQSALLKKRAIFTLSAPIRTPLNI
jgi:hypothetical protein